MLFIDGEGRTIEIEVLYDCAYASHNGRQIGVLETTGLIEIDDRGHYDPAEITRWDVEEAYRRAGIMTKMVEELVDALGAPLAPGKLNRGIGGENALTDEGLGITQALQKKGLIYEFPRDPGDHCRDDED